MLVGGEVKEVGVRIAGADWVGCWMALLDFDLHGLENYWAEKWHSLIGFENISLATEKILQGGKVQKQSS